MGLRVVSAGTGNPANPIQCVVRNLFLLIWPLEALILFFSPKRRLGDIVAGTLVQEVTEIGREGKWQYIQATLAVIGSLILAHYLFNFMDNFEI